jgi:uncharacterized protein (DUF169 family)
MDLSIFNKFNFEIKPVGLNFLLTRPEGVGRLEKKIPLCEMIKEAQGAPEPFYADYDNHLCGGGPGTLGLAPTQGSPSAGWKGVGAAIGSGRLGPKLKIFKNPVANRRTLLSIPRLALGSSKYTLFSPFDKMTDKPDVLIITAWPRQAEIILRAYSYITGAIWEPKTTTIVGCSWLIAYPYLTGKLNYTVTGLGYGMVAWELWPEGLMLISIPYDLLPMITQNLKDMEWELPGYKVGRGKYIPYEEAIFQELLEDTKDK